MKFYDYTTAPSPKRARMFMAEKGIQVETVQVDLGQGEQFSDWFRQLNPRSTVPVLQLDDGTCLCDNSGIAAYLEAAYPDPPLLGTSAKEKGLVASWNSRVDQEGILAVAEAFRNKAKGFKDRALTGARSHAQIPELAARGRVRSEDFLDVLEQRLAETPYLAGDVFSVADISAFLFVGFSAWIKLEIGDERPNLQRWYDQVASRPSARSL
ncbi:MAG: glutathione S-transferase family protein [Xanthomonadales bacterium]|nr:glutathione S-transferase family protein [Xanthomonadales bacterium]